MSPSLKHSLLSRTTYCGFPVFFHLPDPRGNWLTPRPTQERAPSQSFHSLRNESRWVCTAYDKAELLKSVVLLKRFRFPISHSPIPLVPRPIGSSLEKVNFSPAKGGELSAHP